MPLSAAGLPQAHCLDRSLWVRSLLCHFCFAGRRLQPPAIRGLDPCSRVWYWLRGKWQPAQRSRYDRFVWYYRILPVLAITLIFLVLLVALPWLLAI
ncbi:MAG: hypothetical protein HC918_11630 [Oscillatoriales cyanobacterium SM2_1_8]|nr:hypothetical protein [Oscillatoriales cyanobacterium SM2_1_8]